MAQIKTNLQYGVTGTVQSANVADDAITSAKLADDSVVAAAIADNAVVTAAINADAITAAKVADDVINSEHLVDGGVDNAHLATGIASSKLTGALPAISGASLTNLSAGKILQVVGGSATYADSTTSTGYVDFTSASATAWTTAITPSATSSKILVVCHFACHAYINGSSDGRGTYQLVVDDNGGGYTQLYDAEEMLGGYSYDGGGQWIGDTHACTWLHSPNSTNAITFKIQVKNVGQTQVIAWGNSSSGSHMTLMEVGA